MVLDLLMNELHSEKELRYLPKKVKKLPAASNAKFGSMKGLTKSLLLMGIGGRRLLSVKFPKIIRASTMKAQIRIVHPKPTCGISFSTITGKITPPMDDPVVAIPSARDRLRKKYVTTQEIDG